MRPDPHPSSTPDAALRATAQAYRQFICRACGLVYDEALGDPDSGLPPGTRFEDIPDDWECPLCGVTKADFVPHEPLMGGALQAAPETGHLSGAARHRPGIVIVGAGMAAWALVEALRAQDATRPITLVTACSGDRYDKPQISVAMAKGQQATELIKETGADAARRLGVSLMTHTDAIGVMTAAQQLRTTRGCVPYDELVLAHGATPLATPQLPKALCWSINDLRAYAAFRQRLSQSDRPQRVLIVGAGLVGCEVANDLAVAGHTVVLLSRTERPLEPVATPQQSNALLQAWRDLPINFISNTLVETMHRNAEGIAVRTDGGIDITVDHVLSAIGLHTPTRLAQSAGLDWDHGIAVDPISLCTNVPHIHAIGDCISIDGQPLRYIEPIGRQARVIAARLCGGAAPAYEHRPPVIRVKTSSLPLTLGEAAASATSPTPRPLATPAMTSLAA